jgi:hypothetical protein
MATTAEIRKIKTWDALPPVVFGQGEAFSTRILEHRYRTMENALQTIADNGLDARQCQKLARMVLKETF